MENHENQNVNEIDNTASENQSDVSSTLEQTQSNTSSTPKRKRSKKVKNTIVEIVSIPVIDNSDVVQANEIARKANKIALWSNIVSTLLFVVTIVVGAISFYQYRSSITASEIAQRTFEITKKYNDSSLAIQHRAYNDNKDDGIKRNIIDSENRARGDRSLDAQIQSLNQTQKFFEAQNEPYLQIYVDTAIVTRDNQRFVYSIVNLKETPVKIIKRRLYYYVFNKSVMVNIDTVKFNYVDAYITKESPFNSYYNPHLSLTEDNYFGIIKRKDVFMFLKGEIYYQNLISKVKKIYKYTIKITFFKNGNMYQEYIENDNYTIKYDN